MFEPKFTITNQLLNNITNIREKIVKLNAKRYPSIVLMRMQSDARALSVYSSTRIEGNPLPLTDVKRVIENSPANIRDYEREVINYDRALVWLNDQIKTNKFELSCKTICEIQRQVTDKLEFGSRSGNFRTEAVFVNNPRTGETVYWPPDHQDVPGLVNELVDFIVKNESGIDSIILAGIFHRQHVIIHPFTDGNGRTTRLVTKAMLANMGLNTFNLFSFESYYNNDITRYFQNVGTIGNYYDVYDKVDFTVWLEYFTFGIIDELNRVGAELLKQTNIETDLENHHKLILQMIEQYGKAKDVDYAKLTNRSKASRAIDFNYLITLGLIERRGVARNTYYILKNDNS